MSKLPLLSGKSIVKIFEKIGYATVRQRGSHIRLSYPGKPNISVPNYTEVDRTLLRTILRQAEMTPEEFIDKMNE